MLYNCKGFVAGVDVAAVLLVTEQQQHQHQQQSPHLYTWNDY